MSAPIARTIALSVLASTAAMMAPGPAAAAPDCSPGPAEVRTLLHGQGTLESVIVDDRGRLFFTNDDGLLRLDARGGEPRRLLTAEDPGGLAFDADGSLIMGYGNTAQNGQVGDQTGPSGLLRVDPETGEHETYATGLSMANGVDRGPDGSFYASNDFGSNIDRIRDGKTERGWAKVDSGNGLVVDSTGRYLYVAQTFRPAAIQRVEIAHPERVVEYVRADSEDVAAGLDGMDRDAADQLFVTANGSGQVWRIDRKPSICVLLRGLPGFPDGPSAVAVGSTRGSFRAENAYVVTFDGNLIELVGVAEPPPVPRLRVKVRPGTVRVGRAVLRFEVTSSVDGRAVAGARVRFAGRSATTNAAGRARLVKVLHRARRHTVKVDHPDFERASAVVRIVARR